MVKRINFAIKRIYKLTTDLELRLKLKLQQNEKRGQVVLENLKKGGITQMKENVLLLCKETLDEK